MSSWVILLMVAGGIAVILFFINFKLKELKKPEPDDNQQKLMLSVINELRKEVYDFSGSSRKEMQERLDKITDSLTHGINQSSEVMERQFKESRSLIKETAQKISKFEETNKQIAGFAGQLQSLENILRNPKQRGILGEYYLETMLKNVFEPKQYKMQYKFSNGDIVDAAIFYQDKILPIDSKFSMENYNKMIEEQDPERKKVLGKELTLDLKKRISETAKYIRPKEDTFAFAFMYIPSEGMYYDMLVTKIGSLKEVSVNLIEYAYEHKVIPVSPTSFYAYLQTILHGLKTIDMKESMSVIIKKVEQLDRHLKTYEVHYKRLGGNLSTTVSSYNKSSNEFAKIDKDVYRITDGEKGGKLKMEKLDKPDDL
ncbi:MAG: DNA recombination protein RmuC [Patescibacteria group bacterium]|nr:DNA recombination protein RmuC [Patescibacteria group bacterium]